MKDSSHVQDMSCSLLQVLFLAKVYSTTLQKSIFVYFNTGPVMNIGAIGSKLPLCPIRDGHQPSSRGLDTHCKDFLLKVGSPFSFFCDF